MSKIDGKMSFADDTVNVKAKEEIIEIRRTLLDLKSSKEKKDAEV